jgi:hypothetical protein
MTDYQRWLKQVRRQAEAKGWQVTLNGHVKFRSPEGRTVTCSASPRDPQTIYNVRRDLRRAGLAL